MDLLLFGATALAVTAAKRRTSRDDLYRRLLNGTSLNASELVCIVSEDNVPVKGGGLRAQMRLKNLWHRATYILIRHEADNIGQFEDTYVLVQRRTMLKDYCPGKLDPTPGGVVGYGESSLDNAVRELEEEMGIVCKPSGPNTLEWLFTFPYEDDRVRVWGDFYQCRFMGALKDLQTQEEEVDEVIRLSLREVRQMIEKEPDEFMPDACHAMRLYFQRKADILVNRKLLKGYSSGHLETYRLRPKLRVIFFDCDDCLYFDGWRTANELTKKIDMWCVNHGLRHGQAYELYKQYGTALRGLLAEGYLENNPDAIDAFLRDVHDIGVKDLIKRDEQLREILLQIDPALPKYIFTASVAHHAQRCLEALGIADLFDGIIDCKQCDFESKHAEHSFRVAMKTVGVIDPESCLFFDDNITNIRAARQIGWRSVLVGRVGRDCGQPISSEHAELEIDRIHDILDVLPELFGRN